MAKAKILIVEDLEETLFGYVRFLEAVGYETASAGSCKEAKKLLESDVFQLALLDVELPDGSGIDLIDTIRAAIPNCGIIVVTGSGDIPMAVSAMKRGADNFLTKPVDMDEMLISIEKSLEMASLRRKSQLSEMLIPKSNLCFGSSLTMKQVQKFAAIGAKNESPILITGETGTGKGVLAKWIHEQSSRASGNFVEINCSALKGELLRSELYGHMKGAFTSAVKDRPGLIEAADGGTLFLDEIGDMDLEVQAQLLKTLEEKTFRRIGENKLRTSDFRIICATNREMETEVEDGRFRSDLYYRINLFPLTLPSLADRREDIEELARFIFSSLRYNPENVPAEIFEHLKGRTWKGNIREMRNVIERAILLSDGEPLEVLHFTFGSVPGGKQDMSGALSTPTWNLEEIERMTILKALEHFDNNKSEVSRQLGLSSSSLYRKLERYGMSL